MRTAFLLCSAFLAATPAAAAVTIERADLTNGVLVVRGATSEPNTRVTIDGQFSTNSGRNGQFSFRLQYRPEDCTIQVLGAGQRRWVEVEDCGFSGVLARPGTALVNERDGDPPDAVFLTPRIVDPTMGDPAHAFDVPRNLVRPRN